MLQKHKGRTFAYIRRDWKIQQYLSNLLLFSSENSENRL